MKELKRRSSQRGMALSQKFRQPSMISTTTKRKQNTYKSILSVVVCCFQNPFYLMGGAMITLLVYYGYMMHIVNQYSSSSSLSSSSLSSSGSVLSSLSSSSIPPTSKTKLIRNKEEIITIGKSRIVTPPTKRKPKRWDQDEEIVDPIVEKPGQLLSSIFKDDIRIKNQHYELINQNKNSNFKCDWVRFRPVPSIQSVLTGKGKKEIDICIHPFDEVISNGIREFHRWSDCDSLPNKWEEMQSKRSDISKITTTTTTTPIYIDIGANIGACIFSMLLHTNAPILAFEPNPRNLFALNETLSRMGEQYQERVRVVPYALGSSNAKNIILNVASDNYGNSQINTTVKDWESQQFRTQDQYHIEVHRIDNVMNTAIHHQQKPSSQDYEIGLIKMDAQGMECEIVKGFSNDLWKKVNMMQFEYDSSLLKSHNCNDLLPMLRDLGFVLYDSSNNFVEEEVGEVKDLMAFKPDFV